MISHVEKPRDNLFGGTIGCTWFDFSIKYMTAGPKYLRHAKFGGTALPGPNDNFHIVTQCHKKRISRSTE